MSHNPHDLIDGFYIEGATATGVDFADFVESGLRVLDSTLTQCHFDGTKIERSNFDDVHFEECSLPDVSFVDSGFQDTFFNNSRLGGVQAYGTSWTRGGFNGCKVTYLNVRQAKMQGVRFTDCTIDELDLSGSVLQKVSFERCTIEHLIMSSAQAKAVDLRGARITRVTDIAGLKGTIMDPEQFHDLAPSFARLLGITLK